MRRTRILLVEMPRMLGDIIRDAVTRASDMEVVGDVPDCRSAPAVANETRADVVVVGRELAESSKGDLELLCACADVAVVAVAKDGQRAFRYQLRPNRTPLGPDQAGISPQLLLDAIRAAAPQALTHP